MTGCPHGMPTPGSCIDCMDEGLLPPPPRPKAPAVVRTLTARYPGDCRPCGLPIYPGQTIADMSDGTYRHESCA